MKISEVIEAILADDPKLPGAAEEQTVDTFKFGNPEIECTGVATTISATVEVIQKTAELGYNLIITHEPTFYNHEDTVDWLDGDPVFMQKTELLRKYNIAVWRYHDHMHAHSPDKIFTGVIKELGWQDYPSRNGDIDKGFLAAFELPETTPRAVAELFKQKLGLEKTQVIGNPDAKIKTAAFVFHVFGGDSDTRHPDHLFSEMVRNEGFDMIIPGELIDWTVASYIRDAAQLGSQKAILRVGHFNMESLGMKYIPVWLSELLNNKVPVGYVDAGDIYWYV